MQIYLNGKLVPQEDAKISVFDHGLLYGDGVFEGIRAYNGRVFELEAHIERLYDSAKAIALNIPLSPEEMTSAVLETCRANGISDGYIRLIVTRGEGTLGLNPYLCEKAGIIAEARRREFYEKPTWARKRKKAAAIKRLAKRLARERRRMERARHH